MHEPEENVKEDTHSMQRLSLMKRRRMKYEEFERIYRGILSENFDIYT